MTSLLSLAHSAGVVLGPETDVVASSNSSSNNNSSSNSSSGSQDLVGAGNPEGGVVTRSFVMAVQSVGILWPTAQKLQQWM